MDTEIFICLPLILGIVIFIIIKIFHLMDHMNNGSQNTYHTNYRSQNTGYKNYGSQNMGHMNDSSQNKKEWTENKTKFSEDELKAYKLLGVSCYDSDEDIKKAYQKLKKIYSVDNNKKHTNNKKQYGPDRNDNSDNFIILNEILWAWNVIKRARKNRNNRKTTNNNSTDGNIKEADYKYCLFSLYARVMKADGKQMVCELDKIKETIRRYYKTEEQQIEALKEFKSILDSTPDWENVYDTVNRCLNYVAKSELVMELLALAYSDEDFSTVEENVIKEIARKLNFSNEKYKSIYTIFLKKYEAQKYKANNKDKQSEKNHNKSNHSENQSRSNESKNSSNSQSKNKNRISESEAYDILGVSGDFSDVEVKKAYRALAIKYHPDNAASLGDEAIRQATESMKQINMAWEVVKTARGIK